MASRLLGDTPSSKERTAHGETATKRLHDPNHIMTQRIGLFTPNKRKKKDAPTTTTTYIEVADAADLEGKLTALGAKRIGLLCRDRTGATRLEGAMFEPAGLEATHLKWLADKPAEFETRGLFYE